MKLQTSIKPRRDGVVNLTGVSGRKYAFAANEDGDLCCDVEDPADLARLLALGDFFPADQADNEKAIELLKSAAGAGQSDDDRGPDDDLDDDDPVDMNAAPIEGAPAAPPIEGAAPAATSAPAKTRKNRQ
jgi:hypothetical protein